MKITYKIYEFDTPEFLEKRNGSYGEIIPRNVLIECKMAKWSEYNNFNSVEEAFYYISCNREHFKGLELTVLPVAYIDYWNDEN